MTHIYQRLRHPKSAAYTVVKSLFKRAGYKLVATNIADVPDDALYAAYDSTTLARRPFINIGTGRFSHNHWINVDNATD